jgi:hypothetical protein
LKKGRQKKMKNKWAKRTMNLEIVANQVVQKIVENHTRTQFNTTWSPTIIKDVSNQCHHNFWVGLQVVLHKYRGVNLECTTIIQQKIRQ